MAEINVKIKAEDSDLKRKFAESAEAAREFADHVKEQLEKTKDIAADIAGETGFGGIKAGLLGGTVAITAFGVKAVEVFKDSIKEAAEFETAVKGLSGAFGIAYTGIGKDLAEWIETVSGHMGTVEENTRAMKELGKAHIAPEEAKNDLLDIQNIAKKTGGTIDELTKTFLELKLGEIPKGFFHENLAIAELVKARLPAPPKLPGAPTGPEAEEEGLEARVKAMGGAQWLLRAIWPQIAPGGRTAAVRTGPETTTEQWQDLQVQFQGLSREIGDALLPSVRDLANFLKDNMPQIRESVKGFAEELGKAMEDIKKNFGWLGKDIIADRYPGQRTIEAAHDVLAQKWEAMIQLFTGNAVPVIGDLRQVAKEHRESVERLNKILNPQ
jgi:gas vesicle protein